MSCDDFVLQKSSKAEKHQVAGSPAKVLEIV